MSLNLKIYLIAVHLLLAVAALKTGLIRKAAVKIGWTKEEKPELSKHYFEMLSYLTSIDLNTPQDSIIFLGDSSIQHLCVDAIHPNAINFGIGGDTSKGLLYRASKMQSLKKPRLVIISIGTNDFRFRTDHEVIENIRKIISFVPQPTPIILCAAPPIDSRLNVIRNLAIYNRSETFNRRLENLCETDKRIILDNSRQKLASPNGYLSTKYHIGDGMHLNEHGNAAWILELSRIIDEALKALSSDVSNS